MPTTLPYEYAFDFSQGLGDWSTWMNPSVAAASPGEPGFVRLQAPGALDPNHIDGIGSLSLIAHLSTRSGRSPGYLDLRDAEIDIVVRGSDFDAHGAKIVFWVCSVLPDGERFNYPVGGQITNWANTGNDIASAIGDDWRTITVRLDADAADWTEAGNFQSVQGDWGARYQPSDLAAALAKVDATLHLVALSDTPDDRPTGFLDLASITIRTAEPAQPSDLPAPDATAYCDEDGVALGTVAGSDDLADGVTFALVDGSARNGAVTLDPLTGLFAFTPDADFFGPDARRGAATFRYVRIADGVASEALDALVYVTPRTDAPVTTDIAENLVIGRDAAFAFTLFNGDDADGDRLAFEVVDGSVEHGTLALDRLTGRYTFTPEAGYLGAAGFAYTVSDGQAVSAAKPVTFTVADKAPALPRFVDVIRAYLVADPDAYVSYTIQLALAGDVNASYHYGGWLSQGTHVAQDTASAARFLRQGLDATPDAAVQLARLYITGDGVARDYGEARALLAGIGGDPNGIFRLAMLDYLGLGAPRDLTAATEGFNAAAKMGHAEAMATLGRRYLSGEGVAVQADDAYFWIKAALSRPNGLSPGFGDVLRYDLEQAAAALPPERVAELDAAALAWAPGQPTPVNQASVLAPDDEAAEGVMGTVISGTLPSGSDADGDRLAFVVVDTEQAHGVVEVDAKTGAFTYIPDAGFFGEASFTYAVSDGQEASAPRTVALTVARATAAFADAATLAEAATVKRTSRDGVLANDVSRDGSALTVVSVAGSAAQVGVAIATAHGTLTLSADGGYTFKADRAGLLTAGQEAVDTIAYEVADANGDRSTATLTFHIAGVEGIVVTGSGVLVGTRWEDRLTGGSAADYLVGGDGDDILSGGQGAANTLQGGRGDDIYVVLNAGDSLIEFADEGIDLIKTPLASYALRANVEKLMGTSRDGQTLSGNDLANVIAAGAGADQLYGGAGDDRLVGGAGDDRLVGGEGTDTVDVSDDPAGALVNLAGGIVNDGHGGADTLIGIENAIGTAYADTMIGDTGANRLVGGGGRDYLIGGDGADLLEGGAGAANTLQGGRGDDTYVVSVADDSVLEFADEGVDTVRTTVARLALRDHVENLIGLAATGQTLTGNAGANVIRGAGGADVIDGGRGADTLNGGAGADRFVFTAAFVAGEADTIADFRPGEDRIVLSAALFRAQAGQALGGAAFALGAAATDADDRIVYNAATGQLFYDADGSGDQAAVLFALLRPGLAIGASDFVFG